jgi:hypothetical protein
MSLAHFVHEPPTRHLPPAPPAVSRPMPSNPEPGSADLLALFLQRLRDASTLERIRIERDGVPAAVVAALLGHLGMAPAGFCRIAGLHPASGNRMLREDCAFADNPGQVLLCLLDMIVLVQELLASAGDESAPGFDIPAWLGQWILRPQRALGGQAPAALIDTPTGRESVLRLLGALQSGAYL